ncbi:unnamed protein product [Paramecium pentaurelia]|uniref:WD40-repeat-containing domain n=1 Tax=Paramecium pentaurelia TaxID=43138 RepID=A0A8S1X0S7_9CILI|nr:unnamed protein product [Paramecium pentaurelia]
MIFSNRENFEFNQQNIMKGYQAKFETYCSQLQENLQSSFNRIDVLLDQTMDDIEQLFNQRFQQQQQQQQQQSENIQQNITSLIKVSIDNQIKKKEEYLNQEFKKQFNQIYGKEKIQKQSLQETNKDKDLQLQSQNLQQIQTQQPIIQSSLQLILKPFTYNIIHNNSIKQHQPCYAIAINKDCSIVIAGCEKQIKVFQFKQEMLKQTQLLTEHQNVVNTLNFMNKSNHFISESDDNSIIIWSMNQNNQWICQQKLNGHNNSIYCLVYNNNTEDLIISGSSDRTIKFWKKQNQWLCQQTITDHTSCVLGLSLNQQQNKVISCGEDKQILIIEQSQQDSKWIVIQKIMVEKYGKRICFINDNLFTFQPSAIKQMYAYEMNNTNKQYLKTKDILVKCGRYVYDLFPQQHIKSKSLLVNRYGFYVNLIRTTENGEFKTEQSIEFGSSDIYGCISDDAQYLITWDNDSKEIQIRKYIEI